MYSKRTETGYVSDGAGGFDLQNPSSCYLQAKWDFADHSNSSKFSRTQNIYRILKTFSFNRCRFLLMVGPNDLPLFHLGINYLISWFLNLLLFFLWHFQSPFLSLIFLSNFSLSIVASIHRCASKGVSKYLAKHDSI